MNNGSKFWTGLPVAIFAFSLAGCAVSPSGGQGGGGPAPGPSLVYKNFVVLINPVNGKIITPGQGAKASGRGNGYVGFDVDEAGWTTFMIINESPFATCNAPKGGKQKAADWVITRIELSDTGSKVNDSRGKPKLKGDNFGSSVPPWVWQSFTNVDSGTGVVFTAAKDAAPTFVNIYNGNAHDNENLGEKLIYYRVQLTPCDGGEPFWADPAWGNGGKR